MLPKVLGTAIVENSNAFGCYSTGLEIAHGDKIWIRRTKNHLHSNRSLENSYQEYTHEQGHHTHGLFFRAAFALREKMGCLSQEMIRTVEEGMAKFKESCVLQEPDFHAIRAVAILVPHLCFGGFQCHELGVQSRDANMKNK